MYPRARIDALTDGVFAVAMARPARTEGGMRQPARRGISQLSPILLITTVVLSKRAVISSVPPSASI
jgi:hypothetical protein